MRRGSCIVFRAPFKRWCCPGQPPFSWSNLWGGARAASLRAPQALEARSSGWGYPPLLFSALASRDELGGRFSRPLWEGGVCSEVCVVFSLVLARWCMQELLQLALLVLLLGVMERAKPLLGTMCSTRSPSPEYPWVLLETGCGETGTTSRAGLQPVGSVVMG